MFRTRTQLNDKVTGLELWMLQVQWIVSWMPLSNLIISEVCNILTIVWYSLALLEDDLLATGTCCRNHYRLVWCVRTALAHIIF